MQTNLALAPAGAVGTACLNAALGLPIPPDQREGDDDVAGDPAEFAGEYRAQEGPGTVILIQDGRLLLADLRGNGVLRPDGPDSFRDESNAAVRFVRVEGRVRYCFRGLRLLPKLE